MPEDALIASSWVQTATEDLLALQESAGGWPYHAGQAPATEPTALAILALSSHGADGDTLNAAADWLLARQRDDGLFTACEVHQEPSWMSPLAGLALHRLGLTAAAQTAVDALLALPVYTFQQSPPGTYGYDTQIPGWPWTAGDFSFTEPTCLAMIFLKKLGYPDHTRVRDAARMLRDRAFPAGGWNYGEPSVLGGALFPTVAPTALALIALADEQDDITAAALDWLVAQRGSISSLPSLGWTAVALNLLGRLDQQWSSDVINRWSELPPPRRGPMETALCLLGLADPQAHPMEVSA